MKQVNLRLDDELLARIDEARGDVPRERWLRAAALLRLDGPPGPTYVTEPSGLSPVVLVPQPAEVRLDAEAARRVKAKRAAAVPGTAAGMVLPPGAPDPHKFVRVSEELRQVCRVCGFGPGHRFHN